MPKKSEKVQPTTEPVSVPVLASVSALVSAPAPVSVPAPSIVPFQAQPAEVVSIKGNEDQSKGDNEEKAASRQPSRQQQIIDRIASVTGSSEEEIKKDLLLEKKELKRSIHQWNRKFIDENKREPNKSEREKGIGDQYRRYKQITKILLQMDGNSTGAENSSLKMGLGDDDGSLI